MSSLEINTARELNVLRDALFGAQMKALGNTERFGYREASALLRRLDVLQIEVGSDHVHEAKAGLAHLTEARDLLKAAGASRRMIARVRAAISSAKGAVRHAGHRKDRPLHSH